MGSLVAMAFTLALSEAAMLAWGWRVPFLLSILGSGVGVYIRRWGGGRGRGRRRGRGRGSGCDMEPRVRGSATPCG